MRAPSRSLKFDSKQSTRTFAWAAFWCRFQQSREKKTATKFQRLFSSAEIKNQKEGALFCRAVLKILKHRRHKKDGNKTGSTRLVGVIGLARGRLPLPSVADRVVKAFIVGRKQVDRGLRPQPEVRVGHA